MLFERDYTKLTIEEFEIWNKVESEYNRSKTNPKAIIKYYTDLPIAALYYKQLFPNNYICISDLKRESVLSNVIEEFRNLINRPCSERDILNFIKDKKAYSIIASIFDGYRFGHHQAFLFREFELPPNYIADFLLVGKNSGGFEFIFIELESPQGQITTKEGEFGAVIRKGLKQVYDWDNWIEKNYYSLRLVFEKYIGEFEKQLPKEFYELEKSRIHYVVVAGRRSDYNEKTYQLRRKLMIKNDILLLHYDNLLNINCFMRERLLNEENYNEWKKRF